jgi:hypothetical protein
VAQKVSRFMRLQAPTLSRAALYQLDATPGSISFRGNAVPAILLSQTSAAP